jgi:hypothetical protein
VRRAASGAGRRDRCNRAARVDVAAITKVTEAARARFKAVETRRAGQMGSLVEAKTGSVRWAEMVAGEPRGTDTGGDSAAGEPGAT